MVQVCRLKIHILFSIEKPENVFSIVDFQILYNQSKGWIKSNPKGVFLLGKGLSKTGVKMQVQ